MSHPGADLPFLLPRQTKVLMVLDVVESVRLMEQDEDEFVQRWQRLVAQTEHQLLPLHGGRLVKSLGDGLMLEFANAQGCIKTAFALQYLNDQDNEARPPSVTCICAWARTWPSLWPTSTTSMAATSI